VHRPRLEKRYPKRRCPQKLLTKKKKKKTRTLAFVEAASSAVG
jgi:hypothetical protein